MADFKYGFTDKDYENYKKKNRRIINERLREEGLSFADAMCSGSIVEGLDDEEGKKILEVIKKAGDVSGN